MTPWHVFDGKDKECVGVEAHTDHCVKQMLHICNEYELIKYQTFDNCQTFVV